MQLTIYKKNVLHQYRSTIKINFRILLSHKCTVCIYSLWLCCPDIQKYVSCRIWPKKTIRREYVDIIIVAVGNYYSQYGNAKYTNKIKNENKKHTRWMRVQYFIHDLKQYNISQHTYIYKCDLSFIVITNIATLRRLK